MLWYYLFVPFCLSYIYTIWGFWIYSLKDRWSMSDCMCCEFPKYGSQSKWNKGSKQYFLIHIAVALAEMFDLFQIYWPICSVLLIMSSSFSYAFAWIRICLPCDLVLLPYLVWFLSTSTVKAEQVGNGRRTSSYMVFSLWLFDAEFCMARSTARRGVWAGDQGGCTVSIQVKNQDGITKLVA